MKLILTIFLLTLFGYTSCAQSKYLLVKYHINNCSNAKIGDIYYATENTFKKYIKGKYYSNSEIPRVNVGVDSSTISIDLKNLSKNLKGINIKNNYDTLGENWIEYIIGDRKKNIIKIRIYGAHNNVDFLNSVIFTQKIKYPESNITYLFEMLKEVLEIDVIKYCKIE